MKRNNIGFGGIWEDDAYIIYSYVYYRQTNENSVTQNGSIQRHQIMPEIHRTKTRKRMRKATHAHRHNRSTSIPSAIANGTPFCLFTAVIAYLHKCHEPKTRRNGQPKQERKKRAHFRSTRFVFRFSDDFYLYDYCYDYVFYVCSFPL